MPNLKDRIKRAVDRTAGKSFWKIFILTSSNVLNSAATDLTGVATGALIIEKVVLATDATGLAGGTNFEISVSGETYGVDKPIVETVARLDGNKTRTSPPGGIAAETTDDDNITIASALPFVLQEGDKLQFGSSGADCTGAGLLLVLIEFHRIDPQADIAAA